MLSKTGFSDMDMEEILKRGVLIGAVGMFGLHLFGMALHWFIGGSVYGGSSTQATFVVIQAVAGLACAGWAAVTFRGLKRQAGATAQG
jgi:hypothetical protein